jgi:hypothetical protein
MSGSSLKTAHDDRDVQTRLIQVGGGELAWAEYGAAWKRMQKTSCLQ